MLFIASATLGNVVGVIGIVGLAVIGWLFHAADVMDSAKRDSEMEER